MRIPKGVDIRLDTSVETAELHITAAISTRVQAKELIATIRQFSRLLEGEKRVRKPRPAAAVAA